MKAIYKLDHSPELNSTRYLDPYQQLVAKLTAAKDNLFREFSDTSQANHHSIHLALNEAEALAWETGVPHLIFPTLAMEKIRSLAEWRSRQNAILRSGPHHAFAA